MRAWSRLLVLAAMPLLMAGCLDEKVLDGEYRDGGSPGDLAHDPSPVPRIVSPDDGASFTAAQSVSFSGSATDDGGAALVGSSLQWSSDLDGAIGTGTAFTRMLSVGRHTITLTATDGKGRHGSARIMIDVKLL